MGPQLDELKLFKLIKQIKLVGPICYVFHVDKNPLESTGR